MKTIHLGEVVTFLDNLRKPVTKNLRVEGKYPYYGANGIQGSIDDYIFDEPLILLAEDGGNFGSKTRPISYKIIGKTWVNNHAHVLRPKDEIDIDYLNRHLQFYDVSKYISGTTRKKLTKAQASKLEIILPNIDVQKKIAKTLDKADELRQKRKKAIELLDEYLRSVFYDMFGDPVMNEKKWNNRKIGEICKVTKLAGYEYTKYFKYKTEGDVIVIRGLNVKKGKLKLDNVYYIDKSISDNLIRSKLFKDDIVMTYIGVNIGDVAIVPESNKYHLAPNVSKITPKNFNILNSIFLMKILELNRNNFTSFTTNTAKQALNMSKIREVNIILPPIDLQIEFVKIFEQVEKTKAKMHESLKEMDNLFNSLMQQAFKGE